MQEDRFDQLYDKYVQLVYWAAYGVSRDKDDASDAVQTVFLRAYQHLDQLFAMTEPQQKGWLYRVAVNFSIDQKRKKGRSIPTEDAILDLAPVDESTLPEATFLSQEQQNQVRRAVEQLPENYRQPVMLYYFAGLSYHEISSLMSISEGTLKSRMSRARTLLANQLSKGGISHG